MFLRMAVNRRDNRLFWIIGFVNFGKYVKKNDVLEFAGTKTWHISPIFIKLLSVWRECTHLKIEFLFEIFVTFCVPVV